MIKKRVLLLNGSLILGSIAFLVLSRYVRFVCPFVLLLDFPCPTCGMTRALWSVLCLDLEGYIHYNAMALPVGAVVWLFINRPYIKCTQAVNAVAYTVLSANCIYYLLRNFVIST